MKPFVTLPPVEMVRRCRQLRERLEHSLKTAVPGDSTAQRYIRSLQREISFYQPKAV